MSMKCLSERQVLEVRGLAVVVDGLLVAVRREYSGQREVDPSLTLKASRLRSRGMAVLTPLNRHHLSLAELERQASGYILPAYCRTWRHRVPSGSRKCSTSASSSMRSKNVESFDATMDSYRSTIPAISRAS